MFSNTITITIATGQDRVLRRVNQDNFGSTYQFSDADESITMLIRHSTDSLDSDGIAMKRHNVYFERIVFPTPTELMKKQSFTVTMRVGRYEDPAVVSDIAAGVNAWLGTDTNLADLAEGEN